MVYCECHQVIDSYIGTNLFIRPCQRVSTILAEQIPWFKFDDPTVKKGIKFLKGTPFSYPCGGAWDKLVNPTEGATQAEYHLVNEAIVNVKSSSS